MLAFKINSVDARISILGFTDILRSKDHGYANPGEENNDLGLEDKDTTTVPRVSDAAFFTNCDNGNDLMPNAHIDMTVGSMTTDRQDTDLQLDSIPLQNAESVHVASNQSRHDHQAHIGVPPSHLSNETSQYDAEQQSQLYDVWPPFFHPTMLDVLPDGEMLSLPQVDMGSIDLECFDLENWFMPTTS